MSTINARLAPELLAAAPPQAVVRCAHCGVTVPAGLLVGGAEQQFCCAGCRTVFEVIRGCGLEDYYRLREQTATPDGLAPARSSGRRYAEFDHAEFQRLHVRTRPDGLCDTEWLLEGVHCAACVWLVERLPRINPAVVAARLELSGGRVTLTWDPARGALSTVARALDSLGYPPHPSRGADAGALRRREDRALLMRIGVAGAIAGNVMLMAFALYGGFFEGIEAGYAAFLRWTSMGLTLVALIWPGSTFFRGAWAALRTRTAHLDLPIAVGLTAGAAAGVWNTIVGAGEVYFDSLAVLVFLLLVGRWIQRRQQRVAADGLELLLAVTPWVARRIESHGVQEVPIAALASGDLVELRAGDTVPVDGVVEHGRSTLDLSLLTGETRPVDVAAGQPVAAGTLNLGGLLRVRTTATGAQTRVGRLMKLVEDAARRTAPIVRVADCVAAALTPTMLTVAALTALVWMGSGPGIALNHAAAVLLVACPCALGLAAPLTLHVAIARAARRSILIKSGATLELLSRPGRIFLDKTGTLTQGRAALLTWHGTDRVAELVAALETASAHPVGVALRRGLLRDGAQPLDATNVVQDAAGGIRGFVAGHELVVGSPAFVAGAAPLESAGDASLREIVARGQTPVLVSVDGRVVGMAGVGDPLRPDARAALDELRRLGWQVQLLSGDHPEVVRSVGRTLGIAERDARGGLTPEEKLAIVENARRAGPTVMVGDGVNDAAALAAADVGIAVHGGAEASLIAADVYLTHPGLGRVVELIRGGRAALRAVRRAIGVSLGYNTLAVSLAVLGLIHPVVAAILMPLSSLTVLSLALGARTFGRRDGARA